MFCFLKVGFHLYHAVFLDLRNKRFRCLAVSRPSSEISSRKWFRYSVVFAPSRDRVFFVSFRLDGYFFPIVSVYYRKC